MAHKAEKEETEFKAVVAPPSETVICNASSAPSAASPSVPSDKLATFRSKRPLPENRSTSSEPAKKETNDAPSEATTLPPAKRAANRCSGCRRKVGLTGFRCRCGELFCSEHRYSDRHDCGYDYKAAGREAIARENPVVRAAKIVKI